MTHTSLGGSCFDHRWTDVSCLETSALRWALGVFFCVFTAEMGEQSDRSRIQDVDISVSQTDVWSVRSPHSEAVNEMKLMKQRPHQVERQTTLNQSVKGSCKTVKVFIKQGNNSIQLRTRSQMTLEWISFGQNWALFCEASWPYPEYVSSSSYTNLYNPGLDQRIKKQDKNSLN